MLLHKTRQKTAPDHEILRSNACRTAVLRSLAELEPLRDDWTPMVRQPETELSFFGCIVTTRPDVIRPHVIAVMQDGRPRTILVARVEKVRLVSKVGYYEVFRPHVLCLSVLYGGVLGDASEEQCRTLRDSICQSLEQKEFDVVRFNHVDVDSELYRTLRASPDRYWMECGRPEIHWELALPDSIEDLYRMRSASSRGKFRRRQAKVRHELGDDLSFALHTDGRGLAQLLRDMEEVARTTYQRRIGVGFIDNDEWREVFALMFERGQLRVDVMYVGDRPVAFSFGYLLNGRYFYGIPAYDPSYHKLGIGAFLLMHVLEDLCRAENVSCFDYGFGDAEHKRAYSTDHWYEADFVLYAPSTRNAAIRSARRLIASGERLARTAVVKLGWESRLKTALRRRGSPGESGSD